MSRRGRRPTLRAPSESTRQPLIHRIGRSINNSCRITRSPHTGAHSRLYVANNDESCHVYDLIAPRPRVGDMEDDDEDVLSLDGPFAGPSSRTLPVLERHCQLRFPTAINACA